MFRLPILGRLRWIDYQRLLVAVVILILESIVRFSLFFVPFSLFDWIRFHMIGVVPRIFRGFKDEEDISETNDPLVLAQTATEMLRAHGYKSEEHSVYTQDGFLLVMQRILAREPVTANSGRRRPSRTNNVRTHPMHTSRNRANSISSYNGALPAHINGSMPISPNSDDISEDVNAAKRPVVFFMHGCMMSSDVWLCQRTPKRCLPLLLVDAGYDVWLGNRRGNKYSHKHATLRPTQEKYWDFSLDETALIDIPTMINHILENTKVDTVSYIGFSQGSAECFAALSMNKSLNRKIDIMLALAATAKPRHLANPVVAALVRASPELIYLFFGRKVFFKSIGFWKNTLSPRAFTFLIDTSLKLLFNWDSGNMRKKEKRVMYPHLYSYTSTKLIVHWFQIMQRGIFQMYDESPPVLNQELISPTFTLAQITAPIALFYGGKDTLADIDFINNHCPSIVHCHMVEKYEHLDFLWAHDLDALIYPQVMRLLARYGTPPRAKNAFLTQLPLSMASPSGTNSIQHRQ